MPDAASPSPSPAPAQLSQESQLSEDLAVLQDMYVRLQPAVYHGKYCGPMRRASNELRSAIRYLKTFVERINA